MSFAPNAGVPEPIGAWASTTPKSLDVYDLPRIFLEYQRYYKPYLPVDREAAILDFGCGWGTFLAYLIRQGYGNHTGLDIDERCAAFCREHVTPNVYHAADTRAFLAGQHAAYDAAVMREVICYFPPRELNEQLRAIRESLRPGGRLIVQVFNGAIFTGAYPTFNDQYIITVFTEHSLRWALEGAGFRVSTLFGVSGVGRTRKYRVWRAGRRCWELALRAIYLLERGMNPLNPTIFDRDLIAVADRL